jgi:hypothetical protein
MAITRHSLFLKSGVHVVFRCYLSGTFNFHQMQHIGCQNSENQGMEPKPGDNFHEFYGILLAI